MNRDFYSFGNLFFGLGVASGLLQSILHLLVGPQIFWLDSFIGYFLVTSIILLAGSFFILKYYHHQKYWFTFYSGIIVTIVHLFLAVILFMVLVSRQLESYYMPTVVLAVVVGLIYAFSLIFSNAGKSPWLRVAGIFITITGLIYGSGLLWGMMNPDVRVDGTLELVNQWTTLASRLIPVLYMMQFISEIRLLKPEAPNPPMQRSVENLLGLLGMLAFVGTVTFGLMITRDGMMSLYWRNKNAARAQEVVEKSDVRTFVSSKGDSLRYLLMKPLDYDPQRKYPLVVCLPYGGYEAPVAQLLSNDFNRRKYPAFLFVPHCQQGTGWGGTPNYPARDSLVYEAIIALEDPGIDVKRRYVSGVSLGGYGSWHFICKHPEMFAAAIPVCGGGDPALAPNIVHVSVWAFHGEKDRNVPVSGSREMIDAIKKAGGDPRYTEFPGAAHHIWDQVSKTPGLLDWLFAQKRD